MVNSGDERARGPAVTVPAGTVLKVADKAEDHTLRRMADRIQARAIRRCGELLREIKPKPGARTDKEPRAGTRPRLETRQAAAQEAGLSHAQRKQALRVAAVPTAEFEAAVESNTPPTVSALAERGTQMPHYRAVTVEDPITYVISLNLHRRHMTPGQRAMVAARARALHDRQAKERQKRKPANSVPANLPEQKSDARDQVGKVFGVSGKTVDHATKVLDRAVPEVVQAVEHGRMAPQMPSTPS